MTKGGCLCGAVRFMVVGKLSDVVICHCKMCRQWHGAPGPYANAPTDAVKLGNEAAVRWHQSSSFARRGFCPECGSSLFWQRLGGAEISIAAGALDDPTGLKSVKHIFVAHKGDWYALDDGLPQVSDGSGG